MSKLTFSALALAVTLLMFPCELSAGGFRGGGGRSIGGGGGGRSLGGGGISRPASRPSVPSLGGSRPSVSRPSASRPSVSRPAASRPNISAPNISRPATRPANPGLPQVNRPSGGLKPSTRQQDPHFRRTVRLTSCRTSAIDRPHAPAFPIWAAVREIAPTLACPIGRQVIGQTLIFQTAATDRTCQTWVVEDVRLRATWEIFWEWTNR